MSTIDKLKQAQMQRSGEYEKGTVFKGDEKGTVPAGGCSRNLNSRSSRTNANWLISSILFIIIVINLGFTFKLFSMLKENNSKGNNSLEKLAMVGKVVTDQANKINNASSILGRLEKQIESHSVTIEKLIKSNNTLFNKVSSLESRLAQILKQTN